MGDDEGDDSFTSSPLSQGHCKITKTSSRTNIIERSPPGIVMTVSKINALRASINRHEETFTRLMLSSKELVDRRMQIESAFRACKEAFLDVSAVLAHMLEERATDRDMVGDIKRVVVDALKENGQVGATRSRSVNEASMIGNNGSTSYAAVVGSAKPKVYVSRGPTVEVQASTSFLIMPQEDKSSKFVSSQATKETLCKVLKPSDCGLKISNISFANKNGLRVNAISPDLKKLKEHKGLAKAGLKVVENAKSNPRIIVYGIPTDMSSDEIVREITAQNLQGLSKTVCEMKVVYIYPAKDNKNTTNCVLEVTPEVRNLLLSCNRIFLRFSACRFADHVRVLQCYRCLAFGHLATSCKSKSPSCGYCGEAHEMRSCTERESTPKCCNCMRLTNNTGNLNHAATDARRCPILNKKITARVANINYG